PSRPGGSGRPPREASTRSGSDQRRGGGGSSRQAGPVSDPTTAAVEAAVAAGGSATRREPNEEVEASPEAMAAGREILAQLVEVMGYEARVEVVTGASPRITVYGADDEEKDSLGALIG